MKRQGGDSQRGATFVLNVQGQDFVRRDEYEQLLAMLRWIPVGERKPQEQTTVLAYYAGEIGLAKRFSDGWYWDEESCYCEIQPSHWRPLPGPPVVTK